MENELNEHALLEFCFDKANEMASELLNDDEFSDNVGAITAKNIVFNNQKFIIGLDVFWESSNHFDISITGVDNEYKYYKCCNDF